MSWKDIVSDAKKGDDWRARHNNVGKIAKDLDESIQALEFESGNLRKIRDIVALKDGYSVNSEQRRLIKANIVFYQQLFKEILEELK